MRRLLALVIVMACVVTSVEALAPVPAGAATPTFVQARAKEVKSGRTNRLAFAGANTAGNLIVVTVLWDNTGAVTLSDSRGNAYVAASPRTSWGSNWSEQIFFAKDVAGGSNTITATFATAVARWGNMYIHEYSGIDRVNPLDVTATDVGSGAAMSTRPVSTTAAGDLLFAFAGSSATVTSGGSAYTTRSTAYGNRTMDRVAGSAGPYSASATHDGASWVMQLVAFRAAGAAPADTAAPSVPTGVSANAFSTTQVNLSWVASSDNVAVTGYRVFRDGAPVGTSTTTSFQDTGLTAGTGYTYSVSAYDAAGNESTPSAGFDVTTQAVPPDTTPPVVGLTGPDDGSIVRGTVTVAADATDDVGVVGVQVLLDGTPLGAEDTTSPYSLTWDTTTATDGEHTLSARARDAASNTTTSAIRSVTVDNTTPPAAPVLASYAFDEGTGTSATDSSGKGLTGTLFNGATWATGRYGTAVSLDGGNDYAGLGDPSSLRLTGSMTISAWVHATAHPSDDAAVVSKRGAIGFQLDTTIDLGPRTIGFKLTSSTGGDMFRYGATAMQTGNWYHVAGVYDATARTMDVYLNGQLDNGALLGTVTSSQQNSPQDVRIGQRPTGGFSFNGRIDDVRIYGRALTASEILTDMTTPLGGAGASDPTPPTVSISSPASGAQVSDIVTITAAASDNVAVTGVQFYVDDVAVGGNEDTTAPYGLQWDTRTATNGAHTLTARARDAAGNTTTSAGVAVNVTNTDYFQNEVLATGFDLPTSMEFLPDGRLLLVELAGRVRVLAPPYTETSPTPFLQLTNIGSAGVQQGIYDLALDPNFSVNHHYYVFYTLGSPNRDRLSRFTANADATGTIAGSELVLYQDPQDANAEHHGGAITFGDDGKLYFTTGEHFDAGAAQQLGNPRGKIHRVNLDGTAPTDNPFHDGAGPNVDSIWAYGLRNPYRASYDAPTGRLYVGDVGGNDWATAKEEVNVGAAGANYGWPNSEGTCTGSCTSPLYSYGHGGRDASITGGFVYRGSQFPASYVGSYFFADYTQNWIRRLVLDAAGNVTSVVNFEPADGSVDGPYGDIVYLTEGPDGALYYLDLGYSDIGATFGVSKLRRIRFVSGNQAPVAISAATPTSGPAPLAVEFSSAGSLDPEGQALTYSWTFGDGATSVEANPTHTYPQSGRFTAQLSVSDGANTTVSTPIVVSVGTPPTATILSPTDGSLFVAGDVISFSGDAVDADDGTLSASAFTWNIDFLHGGHVHPGTAQSGVKSGSFTIPTSGHDFSGDTRYRITLTVVDSTGLTVTRSVLVYPRKVNLTFATVPPGLTLYVDGIARSAPFVYDTLVGFTHTVEARNQSTAGTTYTFQSWSDGGPQQHSIVVPMVDQTYTATYGVALTPATPAFVQINSATPQTDQTTVAVPYLSAQTGGNTNIVVVGLNNTTSNIASVTDTAGNTYEVAAPLVRGTGISQAIYYARNIQPTAAGANVVTVTLDRSTPYVDIRVTEYAGLDPVAPLIATASEVGSTIAATSGNVTTSAPVALIFGAGTTQGAFTGAAAGYTTRIITPIDADIVVDRNVTSAGAYSAGAVQAGAANWVMQIAAFRAAGQ